MTTNEAIKILTECTYGEFRDAVQNLSPRDKDRFQRYVNSLVKI